MAKPNPAKRYEVSARREGRWIIDCLSASEPEATARADELYADDNIEAVRVVRGRFGHDGLTYETVLHERVREPSRGEPPIRVGRRPTDDAWCESLDDFYGPASRNAIARMLRNFLDRHAITPTELLHHHRYMRLLDRQETLGPQALQRMATMQAAARGVDARTRLDVLSRFADEATSRARDALASRAAPRLGEGGLTALADELARTLPGRSDRDFQLRFAISVAFESVGDPAEKLAMALAWADGLTEPLVPVVDEIVAGLIGGAALVQQFLGPQSHLASALSALAELVQGRAAKNAPKLLGALAQLMATHDLPETRFGLLERVERELAGAKPLSRDHDGEQRRLFDELLSQLSGSDGLILGGPPMVEAIARRSQRLQIIGGIEAIRFEADAASQRIDQLLALAACIRTERQQQALATYLATVLDGAAPGESAPLQARIAALPFGDAAKATLLARLAPPAASAAA
jgi:hypothetical protein